MAGMKKNGDYCKQFAYMGNEWRNRKESRAPETGISRLATLLKQTNGDNDNTDDDN